MLSAQTKAQLQTLKLNWTPADTDRALREPRRTVRYEGWTERDLERLGTELARQ